MPKKNKSLALRVEVLPPARELPDVRRALESFVEDKISEMMNGRDAVFEPFFRLTKIAHEIRSRQTVPEQAKWSYYFEKYGCLIDQTKAGPHLALGMCHNCYNRTRRRLQDGLRGAAVEKGGNPQAVFGPDTLAGETLDVLLRTLQPFVEISEILSGPDPTFEPFFQTVAIANEIRRHQSVLERNKWTYFYDEYGCLVCSTVKRPHWSVGMCQRCYMRTAVRLKESLRRAVLDKADSAPIVLPRDLGDLARKSLLEAVRSGKDKAS
jgi:hypothetical protein